MNLIKLVFLLFLICPSFVKAQQDAQYTNFLFNNYLLNPAVAGLNECLDVRGGYRVQWVGFEDNPKTAFVTANGKIKSWSRRKNGPQHGVGLVVETDNTGPSSRTFVNGSYAVHLMLNRKTRIAFGVHVGAFQYRLDASKIRTRIASDPAILSSSADFVFPDITPGIWLYSEDWFAGASYRHAVRLDLEEVGPETTYDPSMNFILGKVWGNPNTISYIPAVHIKTARNSKVALDVNLWADYKNILALGLAYRNEDAVAGMIKFNFLQYFTLVYAYDFTLSKMRYGSSNSHEIMIGFMACPRSLKKGFIPCAAYN